jgi:transcriptional regulator with XRE-family HTH domain
MKGEKKVFYETLKQVCAENNTSPSAVCDALGMSRSNITKWKEGRSPKLDTVIQISEHLGVSLMKLVPKNGG